MQLPSSNTPPPKILASPLNPTGTEATADPIKVAETRREALRTVERLQRLLGNDDFLWFLEFVARGSKSCLDKGADIDGRDAEKRQAYMQQHAGLESIVRWPEEQLKAAQALLKGLNEQAAAKG